MKSDRQVPVAIVGGGASGTILAVQLARRGIRSLLIEGTDRVNRGVAYSTQEPTHLLNVRAEGMSALAGEPDHFAARFEAEGGHRRGFAERRLFGRYLGELLDEAVESGRVQIIDATASGATYDKRWHIDFDCGSAAAADALVLATGNQEPDALRAFGSVRDRLVANPWGPAAQSAVRQVSEEGGDVLSIGTGLTMVDLALSLDAAGFRGRMTGLSRRGLAPRAHADFEPAAVELEDVPSGDLRALLRWVRNQSARVGWRAAIDSLRPHSHPLWQRLDVEQQRRFLRHARPWWDVHRHRIAPEVADTIARMVAEGRLEILAGRIVQAREQSDGLHVTIVRRGRNLPEQLEIAYAFNCTGPLHSISHTHDPLLRSLLDAGRVRPDHLGIGIEVNENSRADGADRLWALGALTKGRYWEIIAVPDIREQAATVADDIAKELQQ